MSLDSYRAIMLLCADFIGCIAGLSATLVGMAIREGIVHRKDWIVLNDLQRWNAPLSKCYADPFPHYIRHSGKE